MLHILERLKKDQNLNKVINIHRNYQTIKLSENNPFYNSLNYFIKKSLQFLVKMVENDRLPFNYVHFQKLPTVKQQRKISESSLRVEYRKNSGGSELHE